MWCLAVRVSCFVWCLAGPTHTQQETTAFHPHAHTHTLTHTCSLSNNGSLVSIGFAVTDFWSWCPDHCAWQQQQQLVLPQLHEVQVPGGKHHVPCTICVVPLLQQETSHEISTLLRARLFFLLPPSLCVSNTE